MDDLFCKCDSCKVIRASFQPTDKVTEAATTIVEAYRAKVGAFPSMYGLRNFIHNELRDESYNFMDAVEIQANLLIWPVHDNPLVTSFALCYNSYSLNNME